MRHWAFIATACLCLTGCLVMKTGPVERVERPGERKATAIFSGADDLVKTMIRSRSGKAALMLEIVGDLDVEYEQTCVVEESRNGRTAFGFFPWSKADRPGRTPVADHFLALIVNYGLAAMPTFYSLLVEPFSSYPEHGINDHVFAGFSLFGFYRYVDKPEVVNTRETVEKTRGKRKIHKIDRFSVVYDGRVLTSDEDGAVRLPLAYESGMEVVCKLIYAFVPAGNLGNLLPVGKELTWKATGRKKQGGEVARETVFPVRVPSSEKNRSEAVFVSETVTDMAGAWEMFQSHVSEVSVPGEKKREITSVIHTVYRLFDDGTIRVTQKTGGKEMSNTGTWVLDQNVLKMSLVGSDGVVSEVDMIFSRKKDGTMEVRYADLAAYEKLFRKGGVKSAEAHYNERGELVVHLKFVSDIGNGKTHSFETDSVYSPMLWERLDE